MGQKVTYEEAMRYWSQDHDQDISFKAFLRRDSLHVTDWPEITRAEAVKLWEQDRDAAVSELSFDSWLSASDIWITDDTPIEDIARGDDWEQDHPEPVSLDDLGWDPYAGTYVDDDPIDIYEYADYQDEGFFGS